jgi:hypothetical protein
MLDFFNTWNTVRRQQRALFRAFAKWQNTPSRNMGDFGLSITTEISNPSSASVTLQFVLHHDGGGRYESGLMSFECDSVESQMATVVNAARPLLREFLLPSAVADEIRAALEPATPLHVVRA